MKHKIINTRDYLLIIDNSEIKEGDWYLNIEEKNGIKNPFYGKLYKANQSINKVSLDYLINNLKKIIAHLPLNNSPIIEGVDLLPPIEDEVDLKKLSWDYYQKNGLYYHSDIAFINGYNKHAEKYKYTEEDLVWAIQEAYGHGRDEADDILYHQVEESIRVITKYLQQPKIPVGFKCEMEKPSSSFGAHMANFFGQSIPKTTTNSQNLTQWVGEWIY